MIWDNIMWFTKVHESELYLMEASDQEEASKDKVTST